MTAQPMGELLPPTFRIGEWRRFEGRCPRCGGAVVWRALWSDEAGALPGGTPCCDGCAEAYSTPQPSAESGPPIFRHLHDVGVHVPTFRQMTFEAWDDSHDPHRAPAEQFTQAVIDGQAGGRGLFLHGATGNGKTSLAVCCIRRSLEEGVSSHRVQFIRARQFLRQLGEAYSSGGADQLVGRAKGRALWVLDELGKEPPTDHSASLLAEILDERRGGTIITSNHSLPELMSRYAHVDGMEHLISRLGPERFQHLGFTGPDRRFHR